MNQKKETILVVLAFFAIYVIWGSTYLLNKIAVAELPPFMLAGIRFFVAGILVFFVAWALGKDLGISKKQFLNVAFVGFLFLSLGNGLAVWALQYLDSGIAALEISAQPLVILLMMLVLQGKKIQPMSMIGVVLGMLGIYLLVGQQQILESENAVLGIVLIAGCMLSWGYGSIFVSKADLPKNYFVNTAYQMLIAGIFLTIMSLVIGETWSNPVDWSYKVQWVMVLLVVFGSIVAFTSFNYLLKKVSPEKVATSTYVNPIVALVLGWYFLDEQITAQSLVAAAILLTGVYFINTKRKLHINWRFGR